MTLKYLGHSSFFIKSKDAKVIIDPFDPKMLGMKYPKQEADILLMSHQHGDHNYRSGVSSEALVIDWPGEYEKKGVRIFGYKTYHDKKKGAERGENIVFKIEADDVSLLHCGDIGHILEDSLLDEIGEVDILLVPVGGFYTIDAAEAVELTHKIEPSIVVPMHYGHEGLTNKDIASKLSSVDEFISKFGKDKPESIDQLVVKKDDLTEETKLVTMKIA